MARLVVLMMTVALVISMMQAITKEPHRCKACAQLYTEVNHVKH